MACILCKKAKELIMRYGKHRRSTAPGRRKVSRRRSTSRRRAPTRRLSRSPGKVGYRL